MLKIYDNLDSYIDLMLPTFQKIFSHWINNLMIDELIPNNKKRRSTKNVEEQCFRFLMGLFRVCSVIFRGFIWVGAAL